MTSKRETILIVIFVVLVFITGFFVFRTYSFGKDLMDRQRSNERRIVRLEEELDIVALKKKNAVTTDCATILTETEQVEMELWETYENTSYDYVFQYPQSWSLTDTNLDNIKLEDKEANLNMQFRSGPAVKITYQGTKLKSSEDILVACQKAKKSTYEGIEDSRLIAVTFQKNNTPFVVMIAFDYLGASLSSDIIEAFDLILKSIQFK